MQQYQTFDIIESSLSQPKQEKFEKFSQPWFFYALNPRW